MRITPILLAQQIAEARNGSAFMQSLCAQSYQNPHSMQMNDADHRAMYRYIYSIRAKGNPAPDHAPPGTQAQTLTSNLCSKLAGKRNREIALSAKDPRCI